jgi:peroxiredoxin
VLATITVAGLGCAPTLGGRPAPDFRLEEPSGRVLTLSDFRDKSAVVLVFYHSNG